MLSWRQRQRGSGLQDVIIAIAPLDRGQAYVHRLRADTPHAEHAEPHRAAERSRDSERPLDTVRQADHVVIESPPATPFELDGLRAAARDAFAALARRPHPSDTYDVVLAIVPAGRGRAVALRLSVPALEEELVDAAGRPDGGPPCNGQPTYKVIPFAMGRAAVVKDRAGDALEDGDPIENDVAIFAAALTWDMQLDARSPRDITVTTVPQDIIIATVPRYYGRSFARRVATAPSRAELGQAEAQAAETGGGQPPLAVQTNVIEDSPRDFASAREASADAFRALVSRESHRDRYDVIIAVAPRGWGHALARRLCLAPSAQEREDASHGELDPATWRRFQAALRR